MNRDNVYRIIIAEDNRTLCLALGESLTKRDFNIIGTASNGKEVISLLPNNTVDLVLMDVCMPKMDGLEATEYISKSHPSVKVLMLSNYDNIGYVQESIDIGAKGYLLKDTHPDEIATAINTVIGGGNYFSPAIYKNLAKMIHGNKHQKIIKLSLNDKLILDLLSQGLTSDEITVKTGINEHTLKAYRRSMLIKFDAKNVAHLMALAFEQGHLGNLNG